MEEQFHFMRVEPGAFSVVRHSVGEDGALIDVVPVSVLAFLLDQGVPRYAVTLQGVIELGTVPVWGPEETVVMGPSVWPSLEVYGKWAARNMQ